MSTILLDNKITKLTHLVDQKIDSDVLIMKGYFDIANFNHKPFFLAKIVFIINCDKNFVYFWLNRHRFPNLETVYLASHPCELDTLYRNFKYIYLSDRYDRYKERWAKNRDNVIVMPHDDIIELSYTYDITNETITD